MSARKIRVCRLFVIVRADNLPQPLRRRVAIGSAPTSWILISCFPSQFRFLGLMIQVLLYRAIGARRERYQHPDRSFGKQNVAVLCTPLQVQSYKKKLRSTNVSPIIFQKLSLAFRVSAFQFSKRFSQT